VHVVIASLGSACSSGPSIDPVPSICDEVPADIGGCGPERPVYEGKTCEQLGSEWGRYVDAGLRDVID